VQPAPAKRVIVTCDIAGAAQARRAVARKTTLSCIMTLGDLGYVASKSAKIWSEFKSFSMGG
jgi:hypothetical protein